MEAQADSIGGCPAPFTVLAHTKSPVWNEFFSAYLSIQRTQAEFSMGSSECCLHVFLRHYERNIARCSSCSGDALAGKEHPQHIPAFARATAILTVGYERSVATPKPTA